MAAFVQKFISFDQFYWVSDSDRKIFVSFFLVFLGSSDSLYPLVFIECPLRSCFLDICGSKSKFPSKILLPSYVLILMILFLISSIFNSREISSVFIGQLISRSFVTIQRHFSFYDQNIIKTVKFIMSLYNVMYNVKYNVIMKYVICCAIW